jgi:hypothetical protein
MSEPCSNCVAAGHEPVDMNDHGSGAVEWLVCPHCKGSGEEPEPNPELFPDGKPDWASGCIAARRLQGDEWLTVIPLTLGRARLCVATEHNASLEHY